MFLSCKIHLEATVNQKQFVAPLQSKHVRPYTIWPFLPVFSLLSRPVPPFTSILPDLLFVNLYTTLWDVNVQINFTKQETQCINIVSQFAEV